MNLDRIEQRKEIRKPVNGSATFVAVLKPFLYHIGPFKVFYRLGYVAALDTNTSLKELKFTLDSTLGEILDEPLGMKMMEEMLPELVHNPMIEYARQMTLAEGISSAPEVKAVYEAVLKELNAQM